MKHKWLVDVIIAVAAVAALAVWLLCFPPVADVPATAPEPSAPTTTTPSKPTEEDDVYIPNTLSFTGKVLELDGDSVLMDCYDKNRFDTVWVNVSAIDITPQVGEEYTVTYEDLVMPSLPPRITAVKMTWGYFKNIHPTTGEKWYDGLLYEMIDAYPWASEEGTPAISTHPEMGSYFYFDANCTEIGYALIDLDDDGQRELIIGGENRLFPYDVFTIKDEQLTHLFSGHDRNSYYLLEDGYIKHQWSGGAMVNGSDFYRLVDGELQFIERITLDLFYARQIGLVGSEPTDGDEDKCFFRSEVYNAGDEQKGYVSITEKEAIERIEKYNEYEEIKINYHLLDEN